MTSDPPRPQSNYAALVSIGAFAVILPCPNAAIFPRQWSGGGIAESGRAVSRAGIGLESDHRGDRDSIRAVTGEGEFLANTVAVDKALLHEEHGRAY